MPLMVERLACWCRRSHRGRLAMKSCDLEINRNKINYLKDPIFKCFRCYKNEFKFSLCFFFSESSKCAVADRIYGQVATKTPFWHGNTIN